MVKLAIVLLTMRMPIRRGATPIIPAPQQDVAGLPFLDQLPAELSSYPTIDKILLLLGRGAQVRGEGQPCGAYPAT